MKRVLVLDAAQRSALAVTRSLGKHGIEVFTAEETDRALAGCSRHSVGVFTYPSPRLQPDLFIEFLAGIVRERQIEVLLPMTELTTALLLAHQNAFPDVIIPFPKLEHVNALANKSNLMRTAEMLGVPVPRTWFSTETGQHGHVPASLSFPAVLKPARSWLCIHSQWQRAGVKFPINNNELQHLTRSDPIFRDHHYLVQENVSGEGQGVFALYDHGKPLVFFAHRRLREKPPSGGVSVLSESIPVDPVMEKHARTLLDHVGWHGVAMVEFKVAEDGTPYLMEINTRFWGSLQLAVDSGVNFPWLLYQLACGKRPDPVSNYTTGRRLRWLLGDLDSLYLILRDREHYTVADKLRAGMKFMTPSPFRTRHEVNRWSDPRPGWCELMDYIRDLFR
jgi:predicted ATP-grasp superfamily ATP-dependent carboligase